MAIVNDASRKSANSVQRKQRLVAEEEASHIVVLKHKLSQLLPLSLRRFSFASQIRVNAEFAQTAV